MLCFSDHSYYIRTQLSVDHGGFYDKYIYNVNVHVLHNCLKTFSFFNSIPGTIQECCFINNPRYLYLLFLSIVFCFPCVFLPSGLCKQKFKLSSTIGQFVVFIGEISV